MGRTQAQIDHETREKYAYELVKIIAEKAGMMINKADLIGYDDFITGVHTGEIVIKAHLVEDGQS